MEGRRRRRQKIDYELVDSTSSPRRLQFAASVPTQEYTTTPLALPTRHRAPMLENLPEDLLHKIISQLTVKEAGRMSVLSSQWRKRWIYHSNLCFSATSELAGYDTDRFMDHVTTVLQQHSRLAVDRFEVVSSALGKEHAHHIDQWFGFAAASKAKHVVLDLSPPRYTRRIVASHNKYKLPANQLLLIGNAHAAGGSSSCCTSSMVSLLLGQVSLELPISDGTFLGFTSLKKLELKLVADLGDLTPFLSKCSSLEWLSITRSFIPHLVVPQTSCCLRYLHVNGCDLKSIESHAMNLRTFEYIGNPFVPIKINHSSMLSQAKVDLYWYGDTVGYFWDELSCSLSHVDRLFLTFNMDTKTIRFIENPTKLIHLTHLALSCNISGAPDSAFVALRLTQILEAAPKLEQFVLHMTSLSWEPLYLKTTDCIRPHVHHRLKTVQMTGVFGLWGQLELAKYILLSADALEYMTLNLAKKGYPDIPWEPNHTYFLKLENFAKNYLDPQGVYHNVLKIVGLNSTFY